MDVWSRLITILDLPPHARPEPCVSLAAEFNRGNLEIDAPDRPFALALLARLFHGSFRVTPDLLATVCMGAAGWEMLAETGVSRPQSAAQLLRSGFRSVLKEQFSRAVRSVAGRLPRVQATDVAGAAHEVKFSVRLGQYPEAYRVRAAGELTVAVTVIETPPEMAAFADFFRSVFRLLPAEVDRATELGMRALGEGGLPAARADIAQWLAPEDARRVGAGWVLDTTRDGALSDVYNAEFVRAIEIATAEALDAHLTGPAESTQVSAFLNAAAIDWTANE